MDLVIVCPDCHGTGYRVAVFAYAGSDTTGEMMVPRECRGCDGAGRVTTSGWSCL
ncbi:DnaJ-class molecular chaperone [Spinactinospora alkalitolerans]|uniref:DnaJ-class molecular chaperone n=1 Tax=Spinactinospora alkalitolerans TaxID=687207 RepID=A0A852TTI4_9ACTN|nr:hypothetical protein [Spinactinospora alkalitolerans]NYE45250.1 DnaJ-class molecular chaperone [Spinactinospora alkalitolerans]